jgi:multidrug efflux pump
MLLFLQNFRATIIATLVIPVALMGGFLGMWVVGFTVNQLSLFGMVLAIGIVVDDAIVVIENVERIMAEEKLDPVNATRKAMKQIQAPVVAIAIVLMAVFIPSALQSGSVGAIYRQFALTIALSTGFSAILALVFTPALCATIIKPHDGHEKNAFFRWFNRTFDWARHTYTGHIRGAVRMLPLWLGLFVIVLAACTAGFIGVPGTDFRGLPKSFVPEEDQGYALAIVGLPSGATIDRTNAVMDQVSSIIRANPEVEGVFAISGFSFVGSAENVGMAFVRFKPWDERHANAMALIQKIQGQLFGGVKDAMAFVVNLPTIRGLGQFGGFDMYLQDRSGLGHDALMQAGNALIGKAGQMQDTFAGVRPNVLPETPQLKLTIDRVQARSMGLALADVYTAVQLMLAPIYVNDYISSGRVQRVTVQADAPFRSGPDALTRIYVPSSKTVAGPNGSSTPLMIPISNVVQSTWKMGPPTLVRYNGYEAMEIVGSQAPGKSSGEAMTAMANIIKQDAAPSGFGFDWTGQSLQEIISGSQAPLLIALSVFVVFLCLAALYESWSIPVAVMMIIPLGLTGMIALTLLRHFVETTFGGVSYMASDVYFTVGMLTIVGLAAKNAILIVEFAVEEQRAGRPLATAVVDAARLRLRPILMTSFAFILGVLPLAISTGAGANARHAIGTGVIGGMIFATFLGVLFIPIFYVSIRRLLGDTMEPAEETLAATDDPHTH